MAKCNSDGKGKMKTKYTKRRDAERAISFIWGNDSTVRIGDLHVYLCQRCNRFHIGHKLPRPKKETHEAKNDQIGA